MKKTLLKKDEVHYLHFIKDIFGLDNMRVFYSRPEGVTDLDVSFPSEWSSHSPNQFGWLRKFLIKDFEEIILTLGFEQGWEEVAYKNYPIYSPKPATMTIDKYKKLSQVYHAPASSHHLHNDYVGDYSSQDYKVSSYDHYAVGGLISSYSKYETDHNFIHHFCNGYTGKKYNIKLLAYSDPKQFKIEASYGGNVLYGTLVPTLHDSMISIQEKLYILRDEIIMKLNNMVFDAETDSPYLKF